MSTADAALLVLAVLAVVGGSYVFIEDLQCEVACGSGGEQVVGSMLLAATTVTGIAAGVFAFRGSHRASSLLLVVGAACFVAAFLQAVSKLS